MLMEINVVTYVKWKIMRSHSGGRYEQNRTLGRIGRQKTIVTATVSLVGARHATYGHNL